jgi:hypothetical protein
MGTILTIDIVVIVIGHMWFSHRMHLPKPQPFAVHLVDAIVMPALALGWMILVGLVLASIF